MSSICGYWYLNATNIQESELQSMIDELDHWQADKKGKWVDQQVGLGHLMLYNTPESLTEVLPYFDNESNTCITADARIDNRTLLTQKFELKKEATKNKADSWFILEAYKKWGEECTEHLEGDFAFAIWDKAKQKLFCARDQIGIKPFYYYFKDGVFAFATEMKGILALPSIDKTTDKLWIANFILNIRAERVSTFYKHIRRLEAAHQLVLLGQSITIKKYWELDTKTKIHFPSESDYIAAFQEKLEQAIYKRLRSNWSISSELSGGLDSSVIAAVAHKLLSKEEKLLNSISDVMPDPIPHKDPILCDDRKQILEVINHIGIKSYHFVTGEEKTMIDSLQRAVDIHDEPPIRFINIFGDLNYEKTQSLNSRVLLSGFGGDDVVSYAGYYVHEELFKSGKWRTLWSEIKLKTKKSKKSPYRRLFSTILASLIPPNFSLYLYYKSKFITPSNITELNKRINLSGIQSDFYNQHHSKNAVLKNKWYTYKGRTVNEKIASRLIHPRIFHHRLEYCNLSAAHNRVEYRYPLLDLPLIQFFISIPTTEKIKNGWNRYFFRKVSEAHIPKHVSWEYINKGSSSPSYLWRMFRDKELVLKTLKELPKDSKVNDYIDVKDYIEKVEAQMQKKTFNNYGGQRLFLLQKILDRIDSNTNK